jgi:AraC-like DNA-binding protein
MVVRLVRLLEQRGIDPRPVCDASGLSLETLRDPSARIPYRDADALLERCADRIGDGALALALVDVRDETTYDAAGLVLLSSRDLRTGLARAFAFQRLWGDGERFVLRHDEGDAVGTLRFTHPGPSGRARSVLAELAFLETMRAVRTLVRPDAAATFVRFSHARRDDAASASLAKELGVSPTFLADENELGLSRDLLEGPLRAPEGWVARAFEGLAERALDALPKTTSVAARLRALCERGPEHLALGVGQIAERLRMSSRTLQRRLGVEGTSWKAIVDEARRDKAAELTARGTAPKEIAFLLGFADRSALARARARWAQRRPPVPPRPPLAPRDRAT